MIYITVLVSKILEIVSKKTGEADAIKNLEAFRANKDMGATDSKMFMKALLEVNNKEDIKFRQYIHQLKQETVKRVLHILYNPEWGTMDQKHWLMFSKRHFLGLKYN